MILRGSVSPQHRPAITRLSGTMLERVAYDLGSELNRSEAATRAIELTLSARTLPALMWPTTLPASANISAT